jgi:signal peptidase I
VRDFLKGTLKFLGGLVVVVVLVAAILYSLFMKVVEVRHNAMAPTMLMEDRVLVWTTPEFDLGDLVLCEHPREPGRYVIARVVGRAGQEVSIQRGRLHIDGEPPDQVGQTVIDLEDVERGERLRMRTAMEQIGSSQHRIFWRDGIDPRMTRRHEVRTGVFLMNDNRTHPGEDSRTYGEVAPGSCIGKVFLRLSAAPGSSELGNARLDVLR